MERATFIQALRDAADFYEVTPIAPHPDYIDLGVYGVDVVTLAYIARSGGKFDKHYWGDSFELSRTFADDGGRVMASFNSTRDEVCTKRVTGTKTVTVPAVEAVPEHDIEQEIVEWDCLPLLDPDVQHKVRAGE